LLDEPRRRIELLDISLKSGGALEEAVKLLIGAMRFVEAALLRKVVCSCFRERNEIEEVIELADALLALIESWLGGLNMSEHKRSDRQRPVTHLERSQCGRQPGAR
jgi:hypothetical protein